MEPGQQPEASSSGVYSSQGSTHTQNSYSGDACTLHTFLHDEERLISMELSKLASPTATVHPLSSLTQLQVDTAYVDIKPLVEKLAKDRRITNHCSGEATYHYTMEHFKVRDRHTTVHRFCQCRVLLRTTGRFSTLANKTWLARY